MQLNRPPDLPQRIERPQVIVAEGADACFFLMWAIQDWGSADIQLVDFGGISELRPFLQSLRGGIPGSSQITSLVVARDAEYSASQAFESAADALLAAGFAAPNSPFEITDGTPRTGIVIFPGFASPDNPTELADGTLEDLCLATVAGDPLLECVDDFLDCAGKVNGPSHPKKARLHAYLAGKEDFAGLKLGEATRARAWALDHQAVRPIRNTISQM